ncbi:hypothetical protein OB955_05470 [Halobacteria archaeon AArc-m2/3/4]|uniref:Uncharacterized protein n=1 Tax=Natronoglomus mannanivorans TaxID=2979990 RepID=A0AAP2Z1L2_9EURY|nr:hypothetical protein [Halobacteria archaeon AArc-xg1-1]MCU4972182.1 hypothetical protein [Halobacteria archaeon AArc-m2/3/4]
MGLTKFLGSKATRTLTSLSVARSAKRELDNGNRTRAIALAVVAIVAWKWTLVGMAAQGIVSLIRRSGGSTKPSA